MDTAEPTDQTERVDPPPWVDRAPRAAAATLLALLVAGAAVWAIRGRSQWFYGDEWWFLRFRDGGSWTGWFEPHQQHWVTLPVLAYRVLWNVFGASTYKPYLAVAVASHLTVVALLWAVLRRTGVSPWVATVCASILLFFGAGSENVLWAFMITFTWSLGFGLAQLLLADRDPLPRWALAASLACGLGALASSGTGLVIVGSVGAALLVRRGWRRAAVQTVPLLAAYVVWRTALHVTTPEGSGLRSVARFALEGLGSTLDATTPHPLVAAAWVLLVLGGLGLMVWSGHRDWAHLARQLAIPVSFALGAVAFYLLAGRTRIDRFGLEYATRGRFLYVALVLLLPVVAMATDAVARRSNPGAVVAGVLLLAATPANIGAISVRQSRVYPPSLILAVAASPALRQVPADTLPFPESSELAALSAGWLRDQVAAGRMPGDAAVDPDRRAEALARLAVRVEDPGDASLPTDCPPLTGPRKVRLAPDHPLVTTGVVVVTVLEGRDGRSKPIQVGSLAPRKISSRGPIVDIEIERDSTSAYPQAVCG